MLNSFYFILGRDVGCTLRNKLTNVLGLDCKGAAILEINERTNDKDRQYPKVGTDQLYNERIKNGIVRGRSRIICFSSCAKKKKKKKKKKKYSRHIFDSQSGNQKHNIFRPKLHLLLSQCPDFKVIS